MADSSFWRDLAEKFRALLETCWMLRADWNYIVGSGGAGTWRLAGAGRAAKIQFETLARRAASALPGTGHSDLRIVWLEALMRGSSYFQSEIAGIETNDDGSEGAQHMKGTIERVCEASANYCSEMEGKALEAEKLNADIGQARGTLQEMERILSAAKNELPEPPVGQATADAEDLPKKSLATPFGRNLDRLRRESGWTFDEMAMATGIAKKLILGHVNKGKNANPGTVAAYASAFTERLGRPVTVAELIS
jgi:hypothetical protein